MAETEPRYIAVGRRKRAQLEASIPPPWRLPGVQIAAGKSREGCMHIIEQSGILTPRELELTERYDASTLAQMIRERKASSVEITEAFCKRAALASQLTNCLTEFFPSIAIGRAAELDAHLAAGKAPLSPLHGVPVSLKDSFNIPGQDSSLGLAALCFKPPVTESSSLTTLLDAAGAVLYCKTTVPQGLVALDTHGNIFGRTFNPWNGTLTAGGSSGGEGALAALRGSVLGAGTDVGGSIRVPAYCCGLVGVRPSVGRIPNTGQQTELLSNPASARSSIKTVAGPIARSTRDTRLFFDTVSSMHPERIDIDVLPGSWDASPPVPRSLIPWSASSSTPRIRLGVVLSDGLSTPHPPVISTLGAVARAARSHPAFESVTPLDLSSILAPAYKAGNTLMSVDGSERTMDLLAAGDEPLSPWLVGRMRRRGARSIDELKSANLVRDQLSAKMLGVWRGEIGQVKSETGSAGEIDAFICPVAPHAGPPHDAWQSVNYTLAFNLLDLPAGVLSVRRIVEEDCKADMPAKKLPGMWEDLNRRMWEIPDEEAKVLSGEEKKAKEQTLRETFLGGWLGIQIVVPRLEEGKLIKVMEILEDLMAAEGLTAEGVRDAKL